MKHRLLLLASLVVFASCQERDSSPAGAEAGIPLGARLVATGPLPNADQVRVRLTIDGEDQPLQFHDYQSGKQIELGRAPRNAQLSFDLRAFSVAGSDTIWKWFASSSGRADSADHWTFPVAQVQLVATVQSAALPAEPEPGQVWNPPVGTWYTTNGTDPRDPLQRRTAGGGSPPDGVVLQPGMVLRAVLRTVVGPGDTLAGDTLRLVVPAVSVPAPTFDPDTTQTVDSGRVIRILPAKTGDSILFRFVGETVWSRVDSFLVDRRQVEVRAVRGTDTSRVRTGTWTLRTALPAAPTLLGGSTVDPGQILQISVPDRFVATYTLQDTTGTVATWPANGLKALDSSFVLWLRGLSLDPTQPNSAWSKVTVTVRQPGEVRLTAGTRSANTDTVWFRIQADSGNTVQVLLPGALEPMAARSGDSVPVFVEQTLKAWATLGTRIGDTARATAERIAPPPPQVLPSRGGDLLVDQLVSLVPAIPGDAISYKIGNGKWTRYEAPFLLPQGDSVVLQVSEYRNRLDGFDTLVFRVRAGASRVTASGCQNVCNPGDLLRLESTSADSIQWSRDDGQWTTYQGSIVLSASGTYRFRAHRDRDTSALDSLTVRVVYPLSPLLEVVSLAQSAATVRVASRQAGDSVVYQVGTDAPVGTRDSAKISVPFQVQVRAWTRRGTATSPDTTRLVPSSLAAPIPSLAAGTYASKQTLQFRLPVGSLATDIIQVSANEGRNWDVGSMVLLEGERKLWARTARPTGIIDTAFSDTLKGIWTVIVLRPPRIVVPLQRVLIKGDSARVRLDSLDGNATKTEWRTPGGAWRTWSSTGFGSSVFSTPDTWVRLEARTLREANGLRDSSAIRRDSVMIRDMSPPMPSVDSGTFQKDSLVLTATHPHCRSCVAQYSTSGSTSWTDLGTGLRLPASSQVRFRLMDSTRTLTSAEIVRSYEIVDLAAAVTFQQSQTLVNDVPLTFLKAVSTSLAGFTLELFLEGKWSVRTTTSSPFSKSADIPFRLTYRNAALQGIVRVEVVDPRVLIQVDASSGNVSLTAASGRVPQYSVTGSGTDANWIAAGTFQLTSTGRVWLRSCIAGGGVCAMARDTLLTWSGSPALTAAVGKYDGYWILPDGTLATSGSLPLASLKEPVDMVLANGPDGLVRTQSGSIQAWGNLASLLSDADRDLLGKGTEVSLLGTKGIVRTTKGDLYGFGGTSADRFAEVITKMAPSGATRFAQGFASGWPMVVLAAGDGVVRLCVDDGTGSCAVVHKPLSLVIVPPQVTRLQLLSGQLLISFDDGTYKVMSVTYESGGTLSAKAVSSGKWNLVTPILAGGQQLVEVREGGLFAMDLSTGSSIQIDQSERASYLAPGFSSFLLRNTDGSVAHFTFSTSSGWQAWPLPDWASK